MNLDELAQTAAAGPLNVDTGTAQNTPGIDLDSLAGTAAATADMPEGYTIIATTEDGGRVYQKPDGQRGFVGPAMSTEEPDTVARILEGATPADAYRKGYNEDILAQAPVAARASKYVQGTPFVGQFADEAMGAIGGPQMQSGMRATQDAMDDVRPGQALALELAGGLVGGAGMGAAAAPAVIAAAPASTTGQVIAGGAAGLAGGGLEGAATGYGRGRTPDERQRGAITEGALGAGLGAGLGVAAPLIGKGAKNLVGWLKSTEIGSIASELGISTKAAKIIRQALDGEDAVDAARRVGVVGDDAMIADAGPQAAQLLDTVMSEGGNALTTGRTAVGSRAAETTPILRRAFDAILGKPKGVKTAAREISEGSAKARRNAYNAAYNQPIDYASPKGQAIEGVLDRVPPKTMQSAINEANDAMREAGGTNRQIMAKIGDDGAVTFSKPMNVQQLDELKKALGAIAEESKDQYGRLSAEGVRANRLARDLKAATSDAVPVYGRAVRIGGDKIAEDSALSMGRSVLTNNVKLEDVTAAMRGASKAEKTAFKQGLREAIDDAMANVKGVVSDPNADAREAAKIWSQLSSRATRNKIEGAIGETASNRIWALMEREFPMLQTRGAVAKGSQTATRQSGKRAIDAALEPGMVGQAARGEVGGSAKKIVQILNNTTEGADASTRAGILNEVAQTLTGVRGKKAEKALEIIQSAIAGQPISEAQARLVGSVVGSGAFLGGYQSGKQALAPQ